MSQFRLRRQVDAAFCTLSTFRHLLTEEAARGHLESIAASLRPGGIYVLGFDLLPNDVDDESPQTWTERRGRTKVNIALRVLGIDVGRRIEQVQICLVARGASNKLRCADRFRFRTYTAAQFQRLLSSVPSLRLCDVYDFRYDIEQPFTLNDRLTYCLFVLGRRLPS